MATQDLKHSRAYDEALKIANLDDSRNDDVFSLLSAADIEGDIRATYALATWYLDGKHVEKNVAKGVELLHLAATGGSAAAMFDLANVYEEGSDVVQDTRRSFLLYVEASLHGEKQAFYEVYRCYWYGIGTNADRDLAEIWRGRAEFLGVVE